MEGKIVKIISNDYTVLSNGQYYVCKSRGKFRNLKITPLVGDNVIFDLNTKCIMEIKERKNQLIRPYVSNIDQVFIIVSVKHPDLDLYLLDKLLVVIEFNNIKPIICFTKLDLLDTNEEKTISSLKEYYTKIGYQVFYNNQLEEIKKCFKNKITVFTGQSGAGKSTLLNKLNVNLNLETNEISDALGRGKHTTRHVELISMLDGLIADTPGFSSLDLSSMTKENIKDSFREFNLYRNQCRYKDCMHIKESNEECFIKQEVEKDIILKSRYDNYIKFIGEK